MHTNANNTDTHVRHKEWDMNPDPLIHKSRKRSLAVFYVRHWTMDVGSLLHIAAMPLDKRYRPSRSPSISLPTLLSSPYLIPAPAPNLLVAHRQSILTFGHQRLAGHRPLCIVQYVAGLRCPRASMHVVLSTESRHV